MAEACSGIVCEVCGRPGVLNNQAWLRTLCATHGTTAVEMQHWLAPPGVTINPTMGLAWRQLCQFLLAQVTADCQENGMPPVSFTSLQTDGQKLQIHWTGGNTKTSGMVAFIIAFSARLHPQTGEVRLQELGQS